MVYSTERFTDNIPMSPGTPVTLRKPSARKPLYLFTEVLYVKKKTDIRKLGAAKSELKAIIGGIMVWSSIPKRIGHTKINKRVKKYLYN